MIIDSKGKLFGKVSIIDILILVVLIIGAAGAFKFLKTRSALPILEKADTYIVGLYWKKPRVCSRGGKSWRYSQRS